MDHLPTRGKTLSEGVTTRQAEEPLCSGKLPVSDSRSTRTNLCEVCQSLPLSPEQHSVGQNSDVVSLGTVGDVISRDQCPFCRLVASSFAAKGEGRNESWDVSVYWHSSRAGFLIRGHGGTLGFRISFIQEKGHTESPFKQARIVDGTQISIGQVTEWLTLCDRHHGAKCVAPLSEITQNEPFTKVPARVIDVQNQCVVPNTYNCRYMALSYVWGQAPTLRLSKENARILMTSGGLRTLRQQIPRTIDDAIDLVSKIGERYLWVDTLCLIQDDSEDMASGIQTMDLVYEMAIVTIIAASGSDAQAGLPGIRPHSRHSTQLIQEISPSVKMTGLYELDDYLKRSKYSSRAWTFQEQSLSNRSLVFVNDQVYFRCRQGVWSEDTRADEDKLGIKDEYDISNDWGSLLHRALDPEESPHLAYETFLLYYSLRDLTKDVDAINALSGILRRLSLRMKCRLLCGLPVATFDISILFTSYAAKRRPEFPSYSWAGWKGQVDWNSPDFSWYFASEEDSRKGYLTPNYWLATHTWIVWYETSFAGKPRPIWNAADHEILNTEDIGYRSRNQFDPHSCRIKGDISKTVPTRDISTFPRLPEYTLLQFWTVSAIFSLSKKDHEICIMDCRRHRCGGVGIDDEAVLEDMGKPVEFLILSECRNSSFSGFGRQGNLLIKLNPEPFDLYWVMLIKWKGGIAERKGLGQIYQYALNDAISIPEWKQIVLG